MENSLFKSVYNPDVLSCIANLSNDEVFTPPELANKIIDMLPQELFENPDTTFLDPCCKSGVFLREIAKRLIKGLEEQIPDLENRIEHIFSKQLFGIAITELTSLLSRRSVYCSKFPSSEFSAYQFPEDKPQGNIIYQRIKHTWKDGKCIYCGASQSEYDRGAELETHAYQFIHNLDVKKVFNMKFDVIIGNPPYQMSDGGGEGSSATPIYDKFVKNAIKLNPRYLTMIIPARWYSGGKGLDNFRDDMLNDKHLRIIHDFPETSDCFPGINIRGGVCYFLWNRDQQGNCMVYNHKGNVISSCIERPLLEGDSTTFIRYNEAISILNKVRSFNEETMDKRVQSRLPFGIPSNFENYELIPSNSANITLFRSDRSKSSQKQVFIESRYVTKNIAWKDKEKVLVSKASPGGDEYPHSIISTPLYAGINTVCTETYLIVDFVKNNIEGQNLISYMVTRFFRFMMSLIKNTQNISKGVFAFVPVQDYSKSWTDEELYAKYGLTKDEIARINTEIGKISKELSNIQNTAFGFLGEDTRYDSLYEFVKQMLKNLISDAEKRNIDILHDEVFAVSRQPVQFLEHGIQIFIHTVFILMQGICCKGTVQASCRAEGNTDIQADLFRLIAFQNFLFCFCHLQRQFRFMFHNKVIFYENLHTFCIAFAFFQHNADQFCRTHTSQKTPLGTDTGFFHQQFINRAFDDEFLFFLCYCRFIVFHGPSGNFFSTAIKHCRSNAFFHLALYSDFRICHFFCTSIVTVCQENLNHCLHIILQFMSAEDIINHICIHNYQNSFSLSSSSVTGPSFTRATFMSAWNTPVATFLIPSVCAFAHSLSNSSVAISGAAPPL